MLPRIEAGQFVRFTYNPPAKPQPRQREAQVVQQRQPDGSVKAVTVQPQQRVPEPPVKDKQIFVLHPSWQNQVHGIDLARVTPAEQQVLHAIMDPAVKQAVDAGQWPVEGVPNYPLIRDIMRRMDPVELIKNPIAFYSMMVKPFISGKDCYRRYYPHYMYSLQVIQESKVTGAVTNPKPLFHK